MPLEHVLFLYYQAYIYGDEFASLSLTRGFGHIEDKDKSHIYAMIDIDI